MLHYCTQHVLPLGNIHTTPSKIAHAAALLNLAVLAPWADDIQIDWEIRKSARSEILLGDFGGDLQRLCDPLAFSVLGPTDQLGCVVLAFAQLAGVAGR